MHERPFIVVDDNPMELEFVEHCYQQTGLSYPLQCYSDPEELLEFVRQTVAGGRPLPTCVLCDIRLLRLDGITLIQQLRRVAPDLTNVALFTSAHDGRDALRARSLGVDLHLKPTGVQNYTRFLIGLAEAFG